MVVSGKLSIVSSQGHNFSFNLRFRLTLLAGGAGTIGAFAGSLAGAGSTSRNTLKQITVEKLIMILQPKNSGDRIRQVLTL